MAERKYKKHWVGFKTLPGYAWAFTYSMYRIEALRDIPEHGVKKGDRGGYLGSFMGNLASLSHEGSCWIADDAMVVGAVTVQDDAYIGGTSTVLAEERKIPIIIKDNAKIIEHVTIRAYGTNHIRDLRYHVISGNAQISGHATLLNSKLISEDAKICGSARIIECLKIAGSAEISEKAFVGDQCQVLGKSNIRGNAIIRDSSYIEDTNLSGNVEITRQKFVNGKIPEQPISGSLGSGKTLAIESVPAGITSTPIASLNPSLDVYHEILDSIASYETDIVKIIKYPVMTDRTDSFTREMVVAMNNAKRQFANPESNEFKESVKVLENAFLTAESNARKIASTLLSEEEKKKTEKAKDLFRVAANEASSENEKKVAFKQGFKQLEGVLDIPDVAVDTFRIKIGLKEIEA